MIALYLRLPNAMEYTRHCFRGSQASALVELGADVLRIKQNRGWKSNNVDEDYTERIPENKKLIVNNILGELQVSLTKDKNKRTFIQNIQSP